MGVLVIVLTIVNWIVYHKFVRVIYFGNLGKHIIAELIGSYIVAVIETALLMFLGQYVIGFIMAIALIVGFGFAIRELYKTIKDAVNITKTNRNKKNNVVKSKTDKEENFTDNTISESVEIHKEKNENVFCTSCGKKIPRVSKFCTYCGEKNRYQ